jgi:chaperone BCS1
MDFRRLSRAMPPAYQGNSSAKVTDLSPNILDAMIPGYTVISQYVQSALGIDISLFVTIGALLIAGTKGGRYIFEQVETVFRYFCVSSVHIDDGDDLFDMVMSWLDGRDSAKYHRSVTAKTQRGSQWEDAYDDAAGEALDERGLFDFNKWSARTPPRYEPYYGRNWIWHEGRLIVFKRSRKPAQQTVSVSWGHDQQDDILQLDCIGRTTQPIKDLLRGIKSWSLDKKRNTTTIRHPTPKDRARYSGAWSRTTSRPSRPMDTVILDSEQKNMIVNDMNEFLHPNAAKWYATRGIPYRRGYMFHGPPGTGKTSLSFALAGIFGLEIYAISLQEPTLTEGDLMQLFNGLPRRCIVLLEDVDAAGLLRDGNSDSRDGQEAKVEKNGAGKGKKGEGKLTNGDGKENTTELAVKKKDEEYTLKDLAKELRSLTKSAPASGRSKGRGGGRKGAGTSGHPNKEPGAGISLSGLLNAIDGVATHEGRVLIMTTNHPDKLDSALVRPGRVDRRVGFKLAMSQQVKELFVRMYSAGDTSATSNISFANGQPVANGHDNAPAEKASWAVEDLEGLAEEFAKQVPDDMYTPAEIQNHLMRWKKEPRSAIDGVEAWKKEIAEEKEKAKGKNEQKVDDEEYDDDADGGASDEDD